MGKRLGWAGGRMWGSFVCLREDQWGQVSVRVGGATVCMGGARDKVKPLGSRVGSG